MTVVCSVQGFSDSKPHWWVQPPVKAHPYGIFEALIGLLLAHSYFGCYKLVKVLAILARTPCNCSGGKIQPSCLFSQCEHHRSSLFYWLKLKIWVKILRKLLQSLTNLYQIELDSIPTQIVWGCPLEYTIPNATYTEIFTQIRAKIWVRVGNAL